MSTSAESPVLPESILAELREALGADAVSIDAAERNLRSQDVFQWDEAPPVEAVVHPGSAAHVAAVLRIAGRHGLAVAPRGGGVSYTKGYVAAAPSTLSLDLGRLNQVETINEIDRYVTVGAACTWERLADALRPLGLRCAVRGPISGSVATIGGVAAQNTGSAPMTGFLSLEVVLADGSIIHTGSASRRSDASPFYRNYGPDLTGLFLGDTGAYGIKTRCTLAIEPIPAGIAFASLAFDTLAQMTAVMMAVSHSGIPCRQLGMDPLKNRTATKVGVREGLTTLARVVRSAGSVTSGLRQAAGIAAAGQNALDEIAWSMHVTVEGHDQPAADRALAALQPLWSSRARAIAPLVPIALNARPFSIRGILGMGGERWVPIHGLFPFGRAAEVVERTQAFFVRHADRLEAHGIAHSYLAMSFATHWLLEPMFYWPDTLGPLHVAVLGEKARRFANVAPDPLARALVRELRLELVALFAELGAVHSQLGKFYPFGPNLEPDTWKLLSSIKDLLDPQRRLNPGNLGWPGRD